MSTNYQLTIYSLLPDKQQAEEGVHAYQDHVVGISYEYGLISMARCNPGIESSSASKSVEILIDDMAINLSATQTGFGRIASDTFVAQCVKESLDNINEYLYFRHSKNQASAQDVHTSLVAVQYFEGFFGFTIMAGFSCLLFRQDELTSLSPDSKKSSKLLGESPAFDAQVHSNPVRLGDILVLAQTADIYSIGVDYLRTTLSRFPDSIDMAIRQIKTRVSRNSASIEPSIIIARVDELVAKKQGWLNKLRNR